MANKTDNEFISVLVTRSRTEPMGISGMCSTITKPSAPEHVEKKHRQMTPAAEFGFFS